MGAKRSCRLQATARAATRHQNKLFCRAVWQLQRACERARAKCRLRGDVYCLRSADTFTSPLDSIGRYAIEANKPKVFEDAVKMIGASAAGGPAVAEVGAKDLATQPADGETVRTALPLIKANLTGIGQIDPGTVQMRVSGLGVVPATYDPKTGTVSYQVTQKLREKSCSVFISAKSQGKKVEAHWTFGIEESAARAAPPAAQTPKK